MLIKQGIFWTGHVDWNLRNFHGYSTPLGSTYNAYLIIDEQPVLIDTVKYYGFEEMLAGIKALIDPAKIRYIISNHAEMDHSGSIPMMLAFCPQAVVVCTAKGQENLQRQFLDQAKNWKFKIVDAGDSLNIGRRELKFFPVPMVHWPDSMVTYCPQEKILFSNDAFGQHLASSERFVDQAEESLLLREAAKYYANIVMPYGAQVIKALAALAGLDIEVICNSHGLIWRGKENVAKITGLYRKWAGYETDKKAVVVYDTMWHATEKMADFLCRQLEDKNIPVKLFNLQNTHISDIVTEILSSRFLLLGSPVLNNRVLPAIGAFLTYIKGLKPKSRQAFTFGSYGWSRSAFRELEESLTESGMSLLAEGKYVQFSPTEQDLNELRAIVKKIEEAM